MRTIIVNDGQHIKDGKTAIIIPIGPTDAYQIDTEGWRNVNDNWQHGQLVGAVKHARRHTTEVGEVVNVRDFGTMEIVNQVQIVEIKMVNKDDMTTEDLNELGYGSIEDFNQQGYVVTRGWYMRVTPVSPLSASSSNVH